MKERGECILQNSVYFKETAVISHLFNIFTCSNDILWCFILNTYSPSLLEEGEIHHIASHPALYHTTIDILKADGYTTQV